MARMTDKMALPEEQMWEQAFQHFLSHGASDRVAAANADYVTYGKTMNNPMPRAAIRAQLAKKKEGR